MARSIAVLAVLASCLALSLAVCPSHTVCTECASGGFNSCRWCPADSKCHTPGAISHQIGNPCISEENMTKKNQCSTLVVPSFSPQQPSAVQGSFKKKTIEYGKWCGAMFANYPALVSSNAMRLFFRAAHDVVRDLAEMRWVVIPEAKMQNLSDTLFRTNLPVFNAMFGKSELYFPSDLSTRFLGSPLEWAVNMVMNEQTVAQQVIDATFSTTEIAAVSTELAADGILFKKNPQIGWAIQCRGHLLSYGNKQDREAIGIAMVYNINFPSGGLDQYLASAYCVH